MIREKNDMLKERKDFMEHEIENNKELERNISTAERQALRLRQHLQEERETKDVCRMRWVYQSFPTPQNHFLKSGSMFPRSTVLKQ